MSRLPLTPDQAGLSDRIDHSLRQAAEAAPRQLADLLAPKPRRQLLGKRMKNGGMRWGEGGADGRCPLRALFDSGEAPRAARWHLGPN